LMLLNFALSFDKIEPTLFIQIFDHRVHIKAICNEIADIKRQRLHEG